MTREKKKEVKSFSVRKELLGELREVSAASGIVGGMSVIVEDALSAWLTRYRNDPKEWPKDRGLPVASGPVSDDL